MNRRNFLKTLGFLSVVPFVPLSWLKTSPKLWAITVGPSEQFKTIDSAVNAIEPGGTIFIMPNHTHNISSTISKPLNIIGIGNSTEERPILIFNDFP